MNKLKAFWLYLKYHKDINRNYNYALKNGYCYNDEMSWFERTLYWWSCE